MKKIIIVLMLFVINYSNVLQAHATNNYVSVPLKTSDIDVPYKLGINNRVKMVRLISYNLSEESRLKMTQQYTSDASEQGVFSVQLGMNNTPVLDQGMHGTCVTFTITAAVDALLGKGDYVSQLCQLTLGNFMHNDIGVSSGWDGISTRDAIMRLKKHGFVSKTNQYSKGCGGIYQYPLASTADEKDQLSVEAFHKMHETFAENHIATKKIIDAEEVIFGNASKEKILSSIKEELSLGNRVAAGFMLADFKNGCVGAQGTNIKINDTWIVNDEMLERFKNSDDSAAHEMIITGFDDNAVVIDKSANVHKGLIKLRNSWGESAGDEGDFYMSYDYFLYFALEAYSIYKS